MGRLETGMYPVADGREYVDYLAHVHAECRRLVSEGRLPDTDELRAFLATAQQVVAQVRRDVDAASARGDAVASSAIEMSAQEHSRMQSMNDSLRNLLEILEMRQALELNRTPAVSRIAEQIMRAPFKE